MVRVGDFFVEKIVGIYVNNGVVCKKRLAVLGKYYFPKRMLLFR